MKIRLILLLSLIAPLSLFSQKLVVENKDCKLPEKDLKEIKKILNYEAKLYNDLFNTGINDSLEIQVNLFGNKNDFKEAKHRYAGRLHRINGFYSTATAQCYVLKGRDYKGVIIHEASHRLLAYNIRSHSRWLTEGLAEFFETLEVQNDEVVFSAQAGRIKRVRDIVTAQRFDLLNFLNKPNSEWREKENVPDLYSISYSLVYFMIKKKPNALKQMLLLIDEGQSEWSALEFAYGGFKQFETDYINFYRNNLIKPI
jgi:hypothetical protein